MAEEFESWSIFYNDTWIALNGNASSLGDDHGISGGDCHPWCRMTTKDLWMSPRPISEILISSSGRSSHRGHCWGKGMTFESGKNPFHIHAIIKTESWLAKNHHRQRFRGQHRHNSAHVILHVIESRNQWGEVGWDKCFTDMSQQGSAMLLESSFQCTSQNTYARNDRCHENEERRVLDSRTMRHIHTLIWDWQSQN